VLERGVFEWNENIHAAHPGSAACHRYGPLMAFFGRSLRVPLHLCFYPRCALARQFHAIIDKGESNAWKIRCVQG
jgi:hypothetical protein